MRNGRSLRVGEFVPAAAGTARKLSNEVLEDPARLHHLYEINRKIENTLRLTLPVETELRVGLLRGRQQVILQIAELEHTPVFDLPTLDPTFLSWRTKSGFPAFSIFTLGNDTSVIKFSARGFEISIMPEIPRLVKEVYLGHSLCTTLQAFCRMQGLEGLELTARYRGVMPESVREKINRWRSVPVGQPRFEEILIIAEAPDEFWQVRMIPQRDPLVVGIAHGLLWLIDAFDITPLESFAKDFFRQTPVKPVN